MKMTLFAALTIAVTLMPPTSFASGCDPYDIKMTQETKTHDLGLFNGKHSCGNYCIIDTGEFGDDMTPYSYYLFRLTSATEWNQKDLNSMTLQVFKQEYDSSCGGTVRYVVGVNFQGFRYRQQKDLEQGN